MKKTSVKYILSILAASLVLYFLFQGISFSEMKKIFYFDWTVIVATLVIFGIIKLLNTLRFSLVYGIPLSVKLYSLLCYANLILSLFPFRLGEVFYITELQKLTSSKYSEVTAKLIRVRLYDYITIYLLLMISGVYVYAQFSSVIKAVSAVFVLSLIFGLVGVFAVVKLRLSEKVKLGKISRFISIIETELQNNSKINLRKDSKVLGVSLLYWSTRLLMGYFILQTLGVNISFFTITFISLAVFMLTLVPIQFFAGFGITEAGFLFFLTQLGFEYNSTLTTLLTYHLYLLIPVIGFGFFGFLEKTRPNS